MFGLGFGEVVIIALVFLLFVGPKRLPEVMRTFGGWMREVSKAKEEFARSLNEDESLQDLKKSVKGLRADVDDRLQKIRSDLTQEMPSQKDLELPTESEKTEGYE